VDARRAGFSVVELTIALGLTLMVAAAVAAIVDPARGAFAAQPEALDVQQRLRVGVDALTRDLIGAGAGSTVAGQTGPLVDALPPLMPFRRGVARSDPPEAFRTDTITIVAVAATAAQTTLAADLAPGAATMTVMPTAGCPDGVTVCGFAAGTLALIYDAGGAFDLLVIGGLDDAASQLTIAPPGSSSAFAIGASVVEARVHIYSLKDDPVSRNAQLMHADGASNPDVPVLDHVAGLTFDYGAGAGVPIVASELADGPWLPNAAATSRWDADLRRIRTVGVTLRIEAALDALRGPAGQLFKNAGVATSPHRWVPDQEIRFVVSPRSMREIP
jgi:Tfp pilus assembly protein PilW